MQITYDYSLGYFKNKTICNTFTSSTDNIFNIDTNDLIPKITGVRNKVTDTSEQISGVSDNTILRESKTGRCKKIIIPIFNDGRPENHGVFTLWR